MQAVEERISDQGVLKLVRVMLRAGVMEDGQVRREVTGTPQGGPATPPTQVRTWAMVTLRIGFGVALPGAGAAGAGGDAVPDGDLLRADEDVFDEQPQHPLAVLDGGGGGVAAQLGEEAFQVAREGEVCILVGGLGVERV